MGTQGGLHLQACLEPQPPHSPTHRRPQPQPDPGASCSLFTPKTLGLQRQGERVTTPGSCSELTEPGDGGRADQQLWNLTCLTVLQRLVLLRHLKEHFLQCRIHQPKAAQVQRIQTVLQAL